MVTTQPVRKGQEIFNTYGEMANWQLLHMYGFAEAYPGNTNDSADIQMSTLLKAALQGKWLTPYLAQVSDRDNTSPMRQVII